MYIDVYVCTQTYKEARLYVCMHACMYVCKFSYIVYIIIKL